MPIKIGFWILFSGLIAASLAFGGENEDASRISQAYSHLLSLTRRPSISQIKDAFGDLIYSPHFSLPPSESPNPFAENSQLAEAYQHGPSIIATFEKLYPGATFYGMGRDSAFLVDLLDAFYLTLNQKDRALPLEIGRFSFEYPDLMRAYLRQQGIHISPSYTSPRHVVFDATNFEWNSQSTKLLDMLIHSKEAIAHPTAIWTSIAFINTGYRQGNMYSSNLIPAKIPVKPMTSLLNGVDAINRSSGKFVRIPSVDIPEPLAYGLEYTGSYGELKDELGMVKPTIGKLASEDTRRKIIYSQVQLIRMTSDPMFKKRVQQIAQENYKYRFPLTRVTSPSRIAAIRGTIERDNILNERNLQPLLPEVWERMNETQDVAARDTIFDAAAAVAQKQPELMAALMSNLLQFHQLTPADSALAENAIVNQYFHRLWDLNPLVFTKAIPFVLRNLNKSDRMTLFKILRTTRHEVESRPLPLDQLFRVVESKENDSQWLTRHIEELGQKLEYHWDEIINGTNLMALQKKWGKANTGMIFPLLGLYTEDADLFAQVSNILKNIPHLCHGAPPELACREIMKLSFIYDFIDWLSKQPNGTQRVSHYLAQFSPTELLQIVLPGPLSFYNPNSKQTFQLLFWTHSEFQNSVHHFISSLFDKDRPSPEQNQQQRLSQFVEDLTKAWSLVATNRETKTVLAEMVLMPFLKKLLLEPEEVFEKSWVAGQLLPKLIEEIYNTDVKDAQPTLKRLASDNPEFLQLLLPPNTDLLLEPKSNYRYAIQVIDRNLEHTTPLLVKRLLRESGNTIDDFAAIRQLYSDLDELKVFETIFLPAIGTLGDYNDQRARDFATALLTNEAMQLEQRRAKDPLLRQKEDPLRSAIYSIDAYSSLRAATWLYPELGKLALWSMANTNQTSSSYRVLRAQLRIIFQLSKRNYTSLNERFTDLITYLPAKSPTSDNDIVLAYFLHQELKRGQAELAHQLIPLLKFASLSNKITRDQYRRLIYLFGNSIVLTIPDFTNVKNWPELQEIYRTDSDFKAGWDKAPFAPTPKKPGLCQLVLRDIITFH